MRNKCKRVKAHNIILKFRMGANEKLKSYQIITLKNSRYSDRQVAEIVNNLYPSHKHIKKM